MLNTHKFFLIIAGLTFFNTKLVHAGGSFSKGFPTQQEQDYDDERAKEQEAQLAEQRARQAELAEQRARQAEEAATKKNENQKLKTILAQQRAKRRELKSKESEIEVRRQEEQRATQEALEQKKMLTYYSIQAAKQALGALPAIYQGYLQGHPLPENPFIVRKWIKFAFRLAHQQYYTQMIVREHLAKKRLERNEPNLKLTAEEETLAERSGRVAAKLFCDGNKNPGIEEIQETYRLILQEDRNTLSRK